MFFLRMVLIRSCVSVDVATERRAIDIIHLACQLRYMYGRAVGTSPVCPAMAGPLFVHLMNNHYIKMFNVYGVVVYNAWSERSERWQYSSLVVVPSA